VKGGSSVIARMLAGVPAPVKREGGAIGTSEKNKESEHGA